MPIRTGLALCAAATVVLGAAAGCRAPSPDATVDSTAVSRIRVVATTTIVGDIVSKVGGDRIDLEVLLPPDSDPHAFQASPQDMVAVAEADVVFINGLGLESFLEPMLESATDPDRIVSVSEGIDPLAGDGHRHEEEEEEEGADHEEGEADPHVWFDPANVMVWADNTAAALSAIDPAHAETYAANAAAYRTTLEALDAWIRERVAGIPQERRLLVSDHRTFAYFAERYGFEAEDTIFPTTSTLAEPSAGDLAALERRIEAIGVPAVFVGTTVSPRLAERVAADTGAALVRLYTGALSASDGPAPTYERMMRYNVDAIVEALRD